MLCMFRVCVFAYGMLHVWFLNGYCVCIVCVLVVSCGFLVCVLHDSCKVCLHASCIVCVGVLYVSWVCHVCVVVLVCLLYVSHEFLACF